MQHNEQVIIYYDGGCRACNADMCFYKRKDEEKNFSFVDISADSFIPEEHGLDKDVYVNLHAKMANGTVIKGLDTFILIWTRTKGLGLLAFFFKLPIIYHIAKIGYWGFTKIRRFLPRTKDYSKMVDK